jgi:hypothetical protein
MKSRVYVSINCEFSRITVYWSPILTKTTLQIFKKIMVSLLWFYQIYRNFVNIKWVAKVINLVLVNLMYRIGYISSIFFLVEVENFYIKNKCVFFSFPFGYLIWHVMLKCDSNGSWRKFPIKYETVLVGVWLHAIISWPT